MCVPHSCGAFLLVNIINKIVNTVYYFRKLCYYIFVR